MISELNAPLPAFQPATFMDLLCKKLSRTVYYSLVKDTKYLDAEGKFVHEMMEWYIPSIMTGTFTTESNPYDKHNCFKLLSVPHSPEVGKFHLPEFLSFLLSAIPDDSWVENPYFREQRKLLFSLLLPIYSHHPTNFKYSPKPKNFTEFLRDIERELVPCGKTVFIDY